MSEVITGHKGKKHYAAGFLMVSFQKLLTSSTAAIKEHTGKNYILLNETVLTVIKKKFFLNFLKRNLMDETEVKNLSNHENCRHRGN